MLAVIKSEAEDSALIGQDMQVKRERADSEGEFVADLYRYHVIKEELVIGPVVLQKPGPSAEGVTASSTALKRLPQCGQTIPSVFSLTQHKCSRAFNHSSCDVEKQGKQRTKKFTCDICERDFTLKSLLSQHMQHIHNFVTKNKILMTYQICNKHLRSSNVIRQQNIHTGDKPFSCKICNKWFSDKSNLIEHQHVHSGQKPYSCKICKKQFSQSSHLITHQRIHTGEKPYSCKVCNKKFSRNSTLIIHRRIHTGDKPYLCKICSKQFYAASYLIVHQRVHSGQKPYSCKICNKQFLQSSHLITHQRIHTGEKPYSCKICNKQFSRNSSVITHQRIHTGEKP